jgi:hypothetical protein
MRPFAIFGRRLEDDIKTDFKQMEGEGFDCVYLAQNRERIQAVVNTVTNLWVPYNRVIYWPAELFKFSMRVVLHGVFFLIRAPQQKLRTHRSLQAYCATL